MTCRNFAAGLRVLRAAIFSGALLTAPVRAAASLSVHTARGGGRPLGLAAGILTTTHTHFLLLSLHARDVSFASPVAAAPVTDIATAPPSAAPDATCAQLYFYSAGCVLAGARAWAPAAVALATAATGLPAAGHAGGANRIALEAHKKWLLVSATASLFTSTSTVAPILPTLPRTPLITALNEASKQYESLVTAALSKRLNLAAWIVARNEAEVVLLADGNIALADALADAVMKRHIALLARVYDRVPLADVATNVGYVGDDAKTRAAALVTASAATWTDGRTGTVDMVSNAAIFGDATVEERETAATAAAMGLKKRVDDVAAVVAKVRRAEMEAVVLTPLAVAL